MPKIHHLLWALHGGFARALECSGRRAPVGAAHPPANAEVGDALSIAIDSPSGGWRSADLADSFEPPHLADVLDVWLEMQELLGASGARDADGLVHRLEQELARGGLSARSH